MERTAGRSPGGSILDCEYRNCLALRPWPSTRFAANGRKTDASTLDPHSRPQRNCRHHFWMAVLEIWFGGCHGIPLFRRYSAARYFSNGHTLSEKRRRSWGCAVRTKVLFVYPKTEKCSRVFISTFSFTLLIGESSDSKEKRRALFSVMAQQGCLLCSQPCSPAPIQS